MAVQNAMFVFEVVLSKVQSFVESRFLIIKADFADIYSLELRDPKQMHIVIPEPPPLPPESRKGKKKKKAPKKKRKKGKKVAVVTPPPPEHVIQSGQSVLFSSSAEFLIQNMLKFPMHISLWDKEDNYTFIGSTNIPWDQVFLEYLDKIANFSSPSPITVSDEYNIFEEGTAKLMAKLGIRVKLSYLTDKVYSSFRTLSEDLGNKKYLYTGMNSKTTSYICTMKTTDEDYESNCNKIENNYVKDDKKIIKPILYADFKNAPGANMASFSIGDNCCQDNADKPPDSKYKAPETMPSIDFIIDYVQKIIISCNDNMRMLTPRPTIRPIIKATDIERLCFCKETKWPDGELATRFKNESQKGPCPICTEATKQQVEGRGAVFDIANIRGPCGKPDCRIARELRKYIEALLEEDNNEININDIIGPCGSNKCTLAEKIQEFLRHEGIFNQGQTVDGLSTQCDCVKLLKDSLKVTRSCTSKCSKDCKEAKSDSETSICEGGICPFRENNSENNVYQIYYFTLEHDFDQRTRSGSPSDITTNTPESSKYKYCSTECPNSKLSEETSCSKSACSSFLTENDSKVLSYSKCKDPVCPDKIKLLPSPADSNIIINFDDIHNQCCLRSCKVAENIKDLIAEGMLGTEKKEKLLALGEDDPCYCDCECTLNFTKNTTYCAICAGYECLGSDIKDLPEFSKPHPCPIYHKLYDKTKLIVSSPWPEEERDVKKHDEKASTKILKSKIPPKETDTLKLITTRSVRSLNDRKDTKKEVPKEKPKKSKKEAKKVGKFTANVAQPIPTPISAKKRKKKKSFRYPPVPPEMGWNWIAEDVPGMKPRPEWKPGACKKLLSRKYRAIREGNDVTAKRKKAMMGRKKKLEAKPTLTVAKKDGEYTVKMEVFKQYSKERLLFQYPYDEKPPLTYIIGKTEEEKKQKEIHRQRKERRETRRKRRLLQSTFRDKCQEICVKAYNQAIGVFPLPNPNDPECPCFTEPAENIFTPNDSCSRSEDEGFSTSDTDNDDWIIQFSPPAAKWDIHAKHPTVLNDNECQYNYLDFRVKLLDKSGNQVPRFFRGLDGKQQCSDLGGFWTTDHHWVEINKDGYIGPDNRWVPSNFYGPDGMLYSSEDGIFTDSTGKTYKIGIDGYIDKDSKWAWYKNRPRTNLSKGTIVDSKKTSHTKQGSKTDAKIKPDTKLSIVTTKGKVNQGNLLGTGVKNNVIARVKKTVSYDFRKGKNPITMNVLLHRDQNILPRSHTINLHNNRHVDYTKNIAKYHEMMKELEMFDDLVELKPPLKTSRASNTPMNFLSAKTKHNTFASLQACEQRMLRTLTPVKSIALTSFSSKSGATPYCRTDHTTRSNYNWQN